MHAQLQCPCMAVCSVSNGMLQVFHSRVFQSKIAFVGAGCANRADGKVVEVALALESRALRGHW